MREEDKDDEGGERRRMREEDKDGEGGGQRL